MQTVALLFFSSYSSIVYCHAIVMNIWESRQFFIIFSLAGSNMLAF